MYNVVVALIVFVVSTSTTTSIRATCFSITSCNYDCPANCQLYEKTEYCCCQNDKVQLRPVCFDASYGKDDVCCLVTKRNSVLGCYPTWLDGLDGWMDG